MKVLAPAAVSTRDSALLTEREQTSGLRRVSYQYVL